MGTIVAKTAGEKKWPLLSPARNPARHPRSPYAAGYLASDLFFLLKTG